MPSPIHLAPFIWFSQGIEGRPGRVLDTPGQRLSWVAWRQRQGITLLERDGERWVLKEGGILLAQPGTVARWRGEARCVRVCFDPVHRHHRMKDDGRLVHADREPQPGAVELFGTELEPLVAPPHADDLASLLHEIDIRFAGDPFRRAELALRLGGWLLRYARACARRDHSPPLGWASPVQHAEALMRESLDKPHTVTELAALVGLSRSHFVRRYTALRGRGPGAYLEDQRLAEAQAQLRAGGRTVAQVADRVGFASARGLHALFRRRLGLSPSAWRARERAAMAASSAGRPGPG